MLIFSHLCINFSGLQFEIKALFIALIYTLVFYLYLHQEVEGHRERHSVTLRDTETRIIVIITLLKVFCDRHLWCQHLSIFLLLSEFSAESKMSISRTQTNHIVQGLRNIW